MRGEAGGGSLIRGENYILEKEREENYYAGNE